MSYYTMGDVQVKETDKVGVFVLDDRHIEDVEAGEINEPMIIYYMDGDVYIYDNVISFDQTDRGFWVETEMFNFRFDNQYDDEEESSEWFRTDEYLISDQQLIEEFDF